MMSLILCFVLLDVIDTILKISRVSDIFFERLLLTGILDIFSQAVIMPRLLQVLTDKKIAMLGMMSEIVGYSLLVISAMVHVSLFFIIGMILFGIGDAIFGPAFNGLLSKSVTDSEQDRIQGGAQSIQCVRTSVRRTIIRDD